MRYANHQWTLCMCVCACVWVSKERERVDDVSDLPAQKKNILVPQQAPPSFPSLTATNESWTGLGNKTSPIHMFCYCITTSKDYVVYTKPFVWLCLYTHCYNLSYILNKSHMSRVMYMHATVTSSYVYTYPQCKLAWLSNFNLLVKVNGCFPPHYTLHSNMASNVYYFDVVILLICGTCTCENTCESNG